MTASEAVTSLFFLVTAPKILPGRWAWAEAASSLIYKMLQHPPGGPLHLPSSRNCQRTPARSAAQSASVSTTPRWRGMAKTSVGAVLPQKWAFTFQVAAIRRAALSPSDQEPPWARRVLPFWGVTPPVARYRWAARRQAVRSSRKPDASQPFSNQANR